MITFSACLKLTRGRKWYFRLQRTFLRLYTSADFAQTYAGHGRDPRYQKKRYSRFALFREEIGICVPVFFSNGDRKHDHNAKRWSSFVPRLTTCVITSAPPPSSHHTASGQARILLIEHVCRIPWRRTIYDTKASRASLGRRPVRRGMGWGGVGWRGAGRLTARPQGQLKRVVHEPIKESG